MKKYIFIAILVLLGACKEDDEPTKYNYHTLYNNSYNMYDVNTGTILQVFASLYEFEEPYSNDWGDKVIKGYAQYRVTFKDELEPFFTVGCFPDGNSYDIYLYYNDKKTFYGTISNTKSPDFEDYVYLQKDGIRLEFKIDLGLSRFQATTFDFKILD